MTFSYDPAQVGSNLIYRVRLELGDTESGNGVKPNGGNLEDEEIAALASEAGSDFHLTVAKVCRLLSTQWARFADTQAGKVSERASQVSARYAQRAEEYERLAATGGLAFGAGVGGSIFAGIAADPPGDEQSMVGGGAEYGTG